MSTKSEGAKFSCEAVAAQKAEVALTTFRAWAELLVPLEDSALAAGALGLACAAGACATGAGAGAGRASEAGGAWDIHEGTHPTFEAFPRLKFLQYVQPELCCSKT